MRFLRRTTVIVPILLILLFELGCGKYVSPHRQSHRLAGRTAADDPFRIRAELQPEWRRIKSTKD